MPIRVSFTQNLQRHVSSPTIEVVGDAGTLREVLEEAFSRNERVRGYVLDEQGALRRHMVVFVNGRQITDRVSLTDPVPPDAEIYIMQALSGGAHGGAVPE